MTSDARELLEKALKLPEDERVLLVDALSATIGVAKLDPEFAAELVKRAGRVLEGGEVGELAPDVMRRLRARNGLAD